jgi:hypothetical protein
VNLLFVIAKNPSDFSKSNRWRRRLRFNNVLNFLQIVEEEPIFVIIIYECHQNIQRYVEKAKENEFPQVEQCPSCRGRWSLRRHGFYTRNAVENDVCYRVIICRLRCKGCKKTVSLIPDILIPYFQYTVKSVVYQLRQHTKGRGKEEGSRQRIRFYWRRFVKQLQMIKLFFRRQGWKEQGPKGQKEKAIKCLEMIIAFGEAAFLRRSTGHFTHNFMAHSFYHK